MGTHGLSIVVIVALIGWGLYRRVRRTVGFQPLQARRMRVRFVLFTVLLVLLAFTPMPTRADRWFMLVGVLVGLGLAGVAASTTQFQQKQGVWHYRPSGWVSAIVLLIFFGRLAYRMVELYEGSKGAPVVTSTGTGNAAHLQAASYTSDPLTLVAIFILFSYYAGYFLYLLWRERHLERSPEGNLR
ncbi:hypothetical protein [Alicyclobacillus herbarius]|uniref:hypothetical protein n=1 Tax=Alicyclobacillus herbarius TaxID=122960 RepID=UPI0004090F04|nr:hypothetical protein [Alicyclobacillus herbarius]